MTLSPWAERRKLLYTTIAIGVFLVIASVQGFRIFYKAPTCFDGKKNGGENGVDCGGVCSRICSSDVMPLVIQWAKLFTIRENEYSVAAYVENPNRNAGVSNLPYVFKLLDKKGNVLKEIEGVSYAEPNSRFPIFEGPIHLEKEPFSVELEFKEEPLFVRDTEHEPILSIENSTLLSSETTPKISALVRNATIDSVSNIDAVAVVYDRADDPIAVSKTIVKYLPPESRSRITFTWPDAFKIKPSVCEQPTSTVLAIDRSGSMNDDAEDPPQPITDVLEAASTFIQNLKEQDKVGVVSYATEASDPIDALPTFDKSAARRSVSNISITEADETGYTNPGAAIEKARETLIGDSLFGLGGRDSIIVLLTDGQANYPEDPGGEEFAQSEAEITKRDGIKIYTIGLGENINREFLTRIATDPEYYFEAATTEDLKGIYKEIATSVCSLGPSIIEITPRYNIFNARTNR